MAEIAAVPPRATIGIASFRDRAQLQAALQTEFGVSAPAQSRFIQAGAITLACVAPARYLAIGPADANLVAHLAELLDGIAAVTDQSDMWASWRVIGADAHDRLARVVPIDVAPDIFQVGDLALTRAGHLDVRVSRVGAQDYEIATTRSAAADLLHALQGAILG